MHIIKELSKVKNKNQYKIIIDDKTYSFDEDTILEFNLYKGKVNKVCKRIDSEL